MSTKAEKKHYDALARFGCILCYTQGNEGTPAEIHHIRRAGRRGDAPVIPLCPYHHRGSNTSIHGMGRKRFEREYSVTEEELLEKVKALMDQNPTQ